MKKVVCSAVFLGSKKQREWFADKVEELGGHVCIVGDEVICECYDSDYAIIKRYEDTPIHSIKTTL